MIWLKENHSLVGYVPILKKEYSEENIREMSEYHYYGDWSALSILVMEIQGIEFSYYGGFSNHYRVKTQRLVDICFGFGFECFVFPSAPKMEKYISQIFDVFENLTLYKVEEHSEKELKERIAQIKHTLEQLVSTKTLSAIDFDISDLIDDAESSATNLSNLQKIFEDKGYLLSHDIFANINKTLSKKIYKKRKTKAILEKAILEKTILEKTILDWK